jgi:hypothetical protein
MECGWDGFGDGSDVAAHAWSINDRSLPQIFLAINLPAYRKCQLRLTGPNYCTPDRRQPNYHTQ